MKIIRQCDAGRNKVTETFNMGRTLTLDLDWIWTLRTGSGQGLDGTVRKLLGPFRDV